MNRQLYCGFIGAFIGYILLSAAPYEAFAERIIDRSLTPAQTRELSKQLPTISRPTNAVNSINQTLPDFANPSSVAAPQTHDNTVQSYPFMETYCANDARPIISGKGKFAAIQRCARQERITNCRDFFQLPEQTKLIMDNAIACAFDTVNQSAATPTLAAECSQYELERFEFIKRFAAKNAIMQALLFLPEQVAQTSTNCTTQP